VLNAVRLAVVESCALSRSLQDRGFWGRAAEAAIAAAPIPDPIPVFGRVDGRAALPTTGSIASKPFEDRTSKRGLPSQDGGQGLDHDAADPSEGLCCSGCGSDRGQDFLAAFCNELGNPGAHEASAEDDLNARQNRSAARASIALIR
jgi:hypothetical protein